MAPFHYLLFLHLTFTTFKKTSPVAVIIASAVSAAKPSPVASVNSKELACAKARVDGKNNESFNNAFLEKNV
jgi:hypothetical protein